jgi:hypothetical protein
MRLTLAKGFVAVGMALAAMAVGGCKKQAAPARVEPVVRTARWVQPDFAARSLPFEDVDPVARPRRVERAVPQPAQPLQIQPQVQGTDEQNEAVAAAQREQDARLFEQQEAASQRQQEELNQEVEQEMTRQQQVQAEPRIQEIPEVDQWAPPQTYQTYQSQR